MKKKASARKAQAAIEETTKRRAEQYKIEELQAFVFFCNQRSKRRKATKIYDELPKRFPRMGQHDQHIRDMADTFGVNVTKREYRVSPRIRNLLRHLERLISCFEQIHTDPPRDVIYVAGSPSLIPYFGADVVAQFRIDKRNEYSDFEDKFEFQLRHDLPHELIRCALERTQYDIIITSCDAPRGKFDNDDFEYEPLDLQMYLMFDRRHRLASLTESELDWDSIGDMTVVLQNENRDPQPRYPDALFRAKCRKVRAELPGCLLNGACRRKRCLYWLSQHADAFAACSTEVRLQQPSATWQDARCCRVQQEGSEN